MNPNLRQGDELMRLRQFADAAELYQLIPHGVLKLYFVFLSTIVLQLCVLMLQLTVMRKCNFELRWHYITMPILQPLSGLLIEAYSAQTRRFCSVC
jgi:hypothetical protein